MAKGHYVPQVYLRNFTDSSFEKELTWQIIKKKNTIKEVAISNICQKPNLYILNSFNKKNDSEFIEKTIYSEKIEPSYSETYKILIDPEKVSISRDEKELILISLLSFYYRHYDNLVEEYDRSIKNINRISEDLIKGKKETKITNEEITLDFGNLENLISIFKNINKEDFALNHFQKTLDLIKRRLNDSISVIKIPQSSSFISSDRPFYFNNYLGLFSFCLPIDSQHLVLISPDGEKPEIINRIVYDSDVLNSTIELINNEIQYRLCKSIVISNGKSILEDYLLNRKNYSLDNISDKEIDYPSNRLKYKFGY